MGRVASILLAASAFGLVTGAASADPRLNRELAYGNWDNGASFDLENGEKHIIYKGNDAMTYRVCHSGKGYRMTVFAGGVQNELSPGDCWETQASEISATNQGEIPADARVEGTYHRVLGNAGMSN